MHSPFIIIIEIMKGAKLISKVLQNQSLIQKIFFQYVIDSYQSNLLICRRIRIAIQNRIEHDFRIIANKFQEQYSRYFQIISRNPSNQHNNKLTSRTSATMPSTPRSIPTHSQKIEQKLKMLTSRKEEITLQERIIQQRSSIIRQDSNKLCFVMYFKVKEGALKSSQSYQISHSYSIRRKNGKVCKNSTQNMHNTFKYIWKYHFGRALPKGNANFWLTKQQYEYFGYTSDYSSISQKDFLRLQIPYFHIDQFLKDMQFYPLQVNNRINNELECKHKWVQYNYYQSLIDFSLQDIINIFSNSLQFQKIQRSERGDYFKIIFKCINTLSDTIVGHPLKIKEKNTPTLVDLKKRGTIDSRRRLIQLRIGDILVVYLHKADE